MKINGFLIGGSGPVRPSDTTGIWAFCYVRRRVSRLVPRKPGYFLEDVGEVMFADISRSTGLLPEVVRLLDFSINVPTKHNDAILSVWSRRCQYASGDEDCY
jgi:hypothetical protein